MSEHRKYLPVFILFALVVMLSSCGGGPDELPPEDIGLLLKVVRIDWNAEQIVAEPMSRVRGLVPQPGLLLDVLKSGSPLGVALVVSVSEDGNLIKLEFQEEAVREQIGELVAAADYLEVRQYEGEVLQTGASGNVDG